MAVSKSKEKERLEKERIKKVGEKLLKEQMANEPDVKKESQRLMAESSTDSINKQKKNLNEVQSRILNAEKNYKPSWNSDKNLYDKQLIFKSDKDKYQYSRDTNNLPEYKGYLERTIDRNKTMKPLDYGKEAVENIKIERSREDKNSRYYPKFKSNPTSRTPIEKLSEKFERSNIKVGNKLFGENNKFSEWSKVNLDKIAKKAKERQKTNYEQADSDYYTPGLRDKNSGYEYGTGRPISEKVKEYTDSNRLKKAIKKGKK